jgi:hypothetical protein
MSKLPQETSVTIGGNTYRLSKFTIPLYQEFVAWAKAQLPDPWDGLHERIKGLSQEIQKYIIDKAEARAASRGTLNDPEVNALANSIPGVKKMLSLLFRKHHPNLSDEQIVDIIEAGIEEHGADFFTAKLN